MKKYEHHIARKIYAEHYGTIPCDETGRAYEIHHIDGNRNNNDIANLLCVSIQEHYKIHKNQGDWAACILLLRAMQVSPAEKAELLRQHNRKMVEEGIHPFLDPSKQRERQMVKVREGTHHWQTKEYSEKTRAWNLERAADGTHPWCGHNDEKRQRQLVKVQAGTHPFQDGVAASKRNLERVEAGTHPFLNPTVREKSLQKCIRRFTIMFPDGHVEDISEGVTAFCRKHNLHRQMLTNVLDGKQKAHKGFRRVE